MREALIKSGRATQKIAHYHGFEQKRIIGLDEPNLDIFSALEIALVDEVLTIIEDKTAKELRNLTHEFRGWELAEHGEDIPHPTVFLADGAPTLTPEEEEFGRKVAALIG